MAEVTVVICTYNRAELLKKCLLSLERQTVDRHHIKVLVVDNSGDHLLREQLAAVAVDYIHEPTVGLSYARNRGAAAASTPWVFYLDDDAIAHPEMLAHFLSAISQHPAIQVIGGRFEHYFAQPPEKWLPRYYTKPVRATNTKGFAMLKNEEYLSGGIMAAKKNVLLDYPFRTDLGMQGKTPGFGEENEWQDRLRQANIPIHYDDRIAMDHLVQAHKQTIADRIRIAYAHGQYFARTAPHHKKRSQPQLDYFAEVLRVLFISFPYDLVRTLLKPGFYWQNGAVSTLGKLAFLRGKYGKRPLMNR